MARGLNLPKAVEWAQEVTEYINTKHPGGNLQVFTGQFGEYGAMYWFADFEDLAALDHWAQQILAGPGYWEAIGKAEGLFQEGSIEDKVMRSP